MCIVTVHFLLTTCKDVTSVPCGLSTNMYLSVTDRDRLQIASNLLPYTICSGYVEFIYGVLSG